MATKITYRATLADGQVFTRKSGRAYTHFWINLSTNENVKAGSTYTGFFGFAGSLDLAKKAVNSYRKYKPDDRYEIVPVEVVA